MKRTGIFIILAFFSCTDSKQSDQFSNKIIKCLSTKVGSNLIYNLVEANNLLKARGFVKNNSDYLDLYQRAENGLIKIQANKFYKLIGNDSTREEPFMMYILTADQLIECYHSDSINEELADKLYGITQLPNNKSLFEMSIEMNFEFPINYDSLKEDHLRLTDEQLSMPITQLSIVYASWMFMTRIEDLNPPEIKL